MTFGAYRPVVVVLCAGACTFDPSGPSAGAAGDDGGPGLVDGSRTADGAVPEPDAGAPIDASGPDAAPCPGAYADVGGVGCYRVVTASANWVVAEQACEADGGHLIVIGGADENSVAVTLLAGTRGWIGLTDRRVRGFVWVTREALAYTTWASGEPNNGGGWDLGGEGCAEISPGGEWNDTECSGGRPSVCEHDGVAADPTTY